MKHNEHNHHEDGSHAGRCHEKHSHGHHGDGSHEGRCCQRPHGRHHEEDSHGHGGRCHNEHSHERHHGEASQGHGRCHGEHSHEEDRSHGHGRCHGEHSHNRHHGHGSHSGRGRRERQPELLRGRKFSSDDIQLLILNFLSEQPSYGYELIKQFATLSNNFYSPSPGVIYPALTYLEEVGYVTVEAEGNRKRYSLAAEGTSYLEKSKETVAQLLAKLAYFAQQMDSVHQAFSEDNSGLPELTEARRGLKYAIQYVHQQSTEEQQRIIHILKNATQQILQNAEKPE